MGNGTKFKLSNVFPNVLSKIKGIGKNRKPKGTRSSPTPSDLSDTDPNDISAVSRDSGGDRTPSPVRTFPQNRDGAFRYSSSSPGLDCPIARTQKTFDIRFPAESPIRSRGNKLRPRSPVASKLFAQADASCCSYDSTMALVPHDGRVRRVAPQAFGKCLIMSKCNSFNGSTHSDSELSETDTSKDHIRVRSRARSVQLDGTSWEREVYGGMTTADESASQGSDTASVRQRRRERRAENLKVKEKGQLYPTSPVHTACYARGTTGLTHPNSARAESNVDRNGIQGHLSRRLSFTTDDNLSRRFDDTSFSSDDDFYKVRADRSSAGQHRLRSTARPLMHNKDTDAGYTSSELVLTEDERSHAAMLRREAVLAETVRNASDNWARVQSRFSDEDKQRKGRTNLDDDKGDSKLLFTEDETRQSAALYRREASLVRTVLSAQDWARENLRPFAEVTEADSEHFGRLRADHFDHVTEEADEIIDNDIFGLPPNPRESYSRRSSKNPSPVGEVEKHTKGRIHYRSSSPHYGLDQEIRLQETDSVIRLAQPVADYADDLYTGALAAKSETELAKPWDTEFPSFRSDSILLGGGRTARGKPERGTHLDYSEVEVPTSGIFTVSERDKTRQHQDVGVVKMGSRSPSPRQEVISVGLKNFKMCNQSLSHESTYGQKLSSSPLEEFPSGKTLSTISPSPIQEIKHLSTRSPSPPQLQANERNARAEAGMHRLDSVAVVKASYDPYRDFRESMVEMILENDIETAEDLEDLLQCYLSLNSQEYHKIIVQVFSDIWGDIFDQ